ncbi:MAG: hypothetical protein Q9225_001371 [Loekoesia sp. 1 TL-2023]
MKRPSLCLGKKPSVSTCTLKVELAGPTALEKTQVTVAPNLFRGMAGYIIAQCPGGGNMGGYSFLTAGLGGYVTSGMHRLYDWLDHSGDYLNLANVFSTPWPRSDTLLFTVTVQRETSRSKAAGETDIGVAERLLGFVNQLADAEQDPTHQAHFFDYSARLSAKIQEMSPNREDVKWWQPIRSRREMDYTCNKKIDGPAAVDCAKLGYQGLGKGWVDFNQGETKYFNQDTCALAISVNKPMTLSWDQISTGFDTLVNLCLDRPFSGPKGGHATFSVNPQGISGRKRRKKKREDDITGLNAIPQGARIDLWRHGGYGAQLPYVASEVAR